MESSLREEDVMPKELYEAALCGDSEFIENTSDEYLSRKTFVANNIIHVAIRYRNISFVYNALIRVPHLMWEPNLDGNTPLHIAAEIGHSDLVKRLCDKLEDVSPLRMKNSMGSTPLHVAIIHCQIEVAIILVEKDLELAIIVNDFAEAPLHLAIKHFPYDDDWNDWKTSVCIKTIVEPEDNYLWYDEEYASFNGGKMIRMIVVLLKKASHVAGWRDESGLTPLHLAASINTSINLNVILFITECCPQCMEVCDTSGKTILHHLINKILHLSYGKNLLSKTRIHGLRNHQDNNGNTPAHLAVIHSDFIMLELLITHFKANWCLTNKEGLSGAALVAQSDIKVMIEGKVSMPMKEETCCIIELGDLFTLREHHKKIGVRFFKSHDFKGRNIIHKLLYLIKWGCVIIPEEFLEFMEEILDGFPILVELSDSYGDTPAHALAQLNPDKIMIHLATGSRDSLTNPENLYPGPQPENPEYFHSSHYLNYVFVWEKLGDTLFFKNLIELCIRYFKDQWLEQNMKGNTALHEAILANNYPIFVALATHCEEATTLFNKRNETILHLLATNPMPSIDNRIMRDIISRIIKDQRPLLDEDGLTPVMRAIREGNIEFAETIVSLCPSLAKLEGVNGQTFWHMLVYEPPIESLNLKNSSFSFESVLNQLSKKDKDGKTALHLAIERQRFDLAEAFLGLHGGVTPNGAPIFQKHLLKIKNNEGVTPTELIGELAHVPLQFEEFFGKSSTMIGIRSIWGIPSTQIKDYVNTLGVIAALLTTITFTAAFTVPGGLDQEKGTPLLIQDASFQIFMISDIIAMCLSMMVLFCLLWIMATGNKSNAVVLLDFSIILLMASFYATLVTFMTGLYATTYLVKPWIAIIGLVMCTLLLLLMHKYLVMKIIIPTGKFVLIYFDKAVHNARKLRKKLLCRIKNRGHQRRLARSELPTSSTEIQISPNSNHDPISNDTLQEVSYLTSDSYY